MKGKQWDELKEAMKGKHISGRAMAHDLGVHHVTVSRWLNGVTEPCIKELIEIADYVGVSIDALVGRNAQ